MKRDLKDFLLVILFPAILILIIGRFFISKQNPDIIINECPNPVIQNEIVEIIKIELEGGWDCDEPEVSMNMLHPTGYFAGDLVTCWKLDTPIDQYVEQQCELTGDDYWCKR